MSVLDQYLIENSDKLYSFAKENTKYNSDGKPVITRDDEWREQTEWDDLFKKLSASKKEGVE